MIYRYSKIKSQKVDKRPSKFYGKKYFVNNIYPDIPYKDTDQYLITTLGDRLDLLAYNIYKDESLWWIIASANSLSGDSLVPEPGTQLRIPTDIQSIINNYNAINGIR
jgi:hypothetical protein